MARTAVIAIPRDALSTDGGLARPVDQRPHVGPIVSAAPPLVNPNAEFLQAQLDARCLEKEWGTFAYPSVSAFIADPCPAFVIITHDSAGQPRPELSRTKFDTTHPACPRNSEGKPTKYRTTKGAGVVIYGPLTDSFSKFAAATEKWIAEGEHKAQALVGLGLPVLGIGGVWNWRQSGERTLHRDLARHIRPGDVVNLAIDGDWQSNKDVHRGAYALMQAIRDVGATPRLLALPPVPGMPHLGIDDLIAMWRRSGLDVSANFALLQRLEVIPSPFAIDPKRPRDTAEAFLSAAYPDRTLVRWSGAFYEWNGMGWAAIANDEEIRAKINTFISINRGNPKTGYVSDVCDSLKAVAQHSARDVPSWRSEAIHDPKGLIAVRSGLLCRDTRELLPHTPEFFNLNWSDVVYDPDARCPSWLQFLSEVYPGDVPSQELLQDWFGYCLTEDTSQQKMLMMVGVKRSGKGTIARVAQGLVGQASYVSPTLGSLGTNFGLQPLIGKKLAVISDARISGKKDLQATVENMLRISGEDSLSIDRKYLPSLEVRLSTRLWVITNLLPGLLDEGGAFASRFLVLHHPQSFFGRENPALTRALLAELPGILNWALDGLARLRKRGYFIQPASGERKLRDLELLNSPAKAFLAECCDLEPSAFVEKDKLYRAYQTWHSTSGKSHLPDKERFAQQLYAASDEKIEGQRKRVGERQVQVFSGVQLRTEPKY
jgi:putative DNA primase/helicase